MRTAEQKAAAAARARAYRAAHPDKVKERNRRHYEAHREERIEYAKRQHEESREARNARQRERRRDPIEGAMLRERDREKRARMAAQDPEKLRERGRRAHEKTRLAQHGLTPESYAAMLERQGGACAICRGGFGTKTCIDHDHTTGAVRGLLCHSCNVALGHFRDDPELLANAIAYLEEAA